MSSSPSLENTEPRKGKTAGLWLVSILVKEWIKLRWPWILMQVAFLGFALVLILRLRRLFALNDAAAVWSAWIGKAYLFFQPWQWCPVVAGLLIGLLQFLPEVQAGRIRLALHLPVSTDAAIGGHLLAGFVFLGTLLLPSVLLLLWAAWMYFPVEFLRNFMFVMVPPVLGGCVAYLFLSAVLLEIGKLRRVLLLLLAAGTLPWFFVSGWYDLYARVLWPWFFLWTAGLCLVPLLSIRNFCRGD